MDLIEELLKKIPKPSYEEMSELYDELDQMSRKIFEILIESNIFEENTRLVRFDWADENTLYELLTADREVMIPFFMMICGYSDRELEILGIKNVYGLRKSKRYESTLRKFASILKKHLRYPLHIETLIYKFYKNWEEHQKRHHRARSAEKQILKRLKTENIPAGKLRIERLGREIDCAIPPDFNRLKIAIQIRVGVRKDLIKRVKEFSQEFDELLRIKPDIKFIPVYVSRDKTGQKEEILERIKEERKGKDPYEAIIVAKSIKEAADELVKVLQTILSS